MNVSFSPRRYRSALLDQFASSATPITPPRPTRVREDLCIDHSSLIGPYPSNSQTRSIVLDFIDQCVAHHVPESVIVEHVLFMVHAMQEQITMTEALHARYHHDRLREYEMSELTNMLERQQTYYDQLHQTPPMERHVVEPIVMMPLSSHEATSVRHGGRVQMAVQTTPAATRTAPLRERRRVNAATAAATTTRSAFTQTPVENKMTPRTSGAATSFRRFMRPTDASNRKERRKYDTSALLREEWHPHHPHSDQQQQQEQQQQRARQRQVQRHQLQQQQRQREEQQRADVAARGRRRLLMRVEEPKATSMERWSTWSDEETHTTKEYTNKESEGDGRGEREKMNPLKGEEDTRYAQWDNNETPISLSPQPIGTAAPPMWVDPSSRGAVSMRLQAYVEKSQRKIREAERLLARTPSARPRRSRSMSCSPLDDVVSELSDE